MQSARAGPSIINIFTEVVNDMVNIIFNKKAAYIFPMMLLMFVFFNSSAAGERKILRFTGYGAPLGTTKNGTLDPLRTYDLLFFNLQHQIFETLVAVDLNNQEVIPELAESWKKTDDRTIRFYLRHGVRFHNGEPFTAEAVKFSLDLMKDPRNKFAGRYLLDSIASVHIINDHTVDVVMNFRDVVILRKLAAIGFIFPPEYYKRVGNTYFTRYPMGTGPFRFFYIDTDEEKLTSIHLVANEDYWQDLHHSLKKLVFSFIPGEQQWDALIKQKVDLVITQYIESEKQLQSNPALKIISQQTLRHSTCLLNIDKPGPLADIRVRKALQHCINRQAIITQALKGHGTPLYASVPEGTLGRLANTPVYEQDVKKAGELLQQAGYPNGFTLKVMAAQARHTIDVVAVLKEQLKQIGVTLDPYYLTREELVAEIIAPKLQGIFKPSTFDMWLITGWPNVFGTGTHFYSLYLHSHGMFNFGTFLNKESPVDEIYTRTIQSADKSMLGSNLQVLDRYIMKQSLIIPLYQVEVIYGMQKNIHYSPGMNDLPHRFWNCSVE